MIAVKLAVTFAAFVALASCGSESGRDGAVAELVDAATVDAEVDAGLAVDTGVCERPCGTQCCPEGKTCSCISQFNPSGLCLGPGPHACPN